MDLRKYLIFIVLFLLLASAVMAFPIVTTTDISIISGVQKMMSHFSTALPVAIGDLTYGNKYWFFILFVMLLLIIKRKYISCVLFLATIQCSVLFSDMLKVLFGRHRPPIEMQVTPLTNFSFPSGHSLLNMCFFGICFFLVSRYVQNKILKRILMSLCVFMILFVGFTRLWLGVHYPTDVLGGYIIGYIFVMLFADIENRLQKNESV